MARRLSDHYDPVKYGIISLLICVFLVVGVSAEQSSQGDELEIIDYYKYSEYGINLDINKEELLQNLPPKLGEYSVQGEVKRYTKYRAQLYPLSDLKGVNIDSVNSRPAYILVLYDERGQSQLVLLKRNENTFVKTWEGPICIGIGFVEFQDINGDSIPEVMVKLALDSHGYGNVFYYMTTSDSIVPMHEGATRGGISEFCGYIDLVKSDRGTTISVYHPEEKFSREYYIAAKTDRLILSKKTPIDKINK